MDIDILLIILGVLSIIASLIGVLLSVKTFFLKKRAKLELMRILENDSDTAEKILSNSDVEEIIDTIESVAAQLPDEQRKQIKGLQQPSKEGRLNYANSLISKKTIVKAFETWFNQNRELLKNEICNKWNYRQKKEQFIGKETLLIVLLADSLALTFALPLATVTVATILVIDDYLDKLCDCDDKN